MPVLVVAVVLHDTEPVQPEVGAPSMQGRSTSMAECVDADRVRMLGTMDGKSVLCKGRLHADPTPRVGNGRVGSRGELREFDYADKSLVLQHLTVNQAKMSGSRNRGNIEAAFTGVDRSNEDVADHPRTAPESPTSPLTDRQKN